MSTQLTRLQAQTDLQTLIWRICAWAGPVFFIGLIIFWAGIAHFVPPPPQYLSAEAVRDFYVTYDLRIRIGMVGVAVCAPLYFVWSAAISKVIQFMEGPDGVLANIELMGGVCTALATLGFSLVWLTAAFRIDSRSASHVQLLNDLGWIIFFMTFGVTLVQMLAFGTAVLGDSRATPLLPQWVGWLTFAVCGILLLTLLMPFVMDGPFAWHGLVTFWTTLNAYFAWALVTCAQVFYAIKRVAIMSEGVEQITTRAVA